MKNVHLAPAWLVQLEKKLHQLHPHPQFRLFLTMEISPRLPVNLLRAGRIFVYEPPPGLRANLLRTFSTVSMECNIPATSMLLSRYLVPQHTNAINITLVLKTMFTCISFVIASEAIFVKSTIAFYEALAF